MTDEELRELERAAEAASPDAVRWMRAILDNGTNPPPPRRKPKPGDLALHRGTGDHYVMVMRTNTANLQAQLTDDVVVRTAPYQTDCWVCHRVGSSADKTIVLPEVLFEVVHQRPTSPLSAPSPWWKIW